ncbi:mucin-like protein [Carassius auratus]|uniref:Mucin-like protein n=1 Tax=Carassius auratus TaxID=7957 RepID=A0A6P6L3I8_CARAU|nr:mucin-like protein [Carassius auratus]
MSCGSISSLYLGGYHPRIEYGVVSREVYGSRYDQCSYYRSEPIQVKACPGDYYVYKLTRPTLLIPLPVYCAVPFTTPSVDPCYNYTSLDEPWRATDYSNNISYYNIVCDNNVEWNGWYRMFYNGQNAQMPESCVSYGMCGTVYPMSLNGPHPQLEDGVVLRQICTSVWSGCCDLSSHPIRVKACPGNYYVYEFVKPMFCGAYCVGPAVFYPFGSAAGDTINAAVDDGNSSVIQLLSPFLFFGRTYQQIYVNNNGHLTFNQSSSAFVPYSFPARGSQDIIAGLWTNLDNRQRGVVSYQQFTSGNVLTRATRDINTHFPNLTFTASWVFVATWDKVAYFNLNNTETSFQVVLISGGDFSFILMNYGDIAVTGHPVQAGYDTINSTHYFVIPGSINGSFISNLRNSSNVDVPGRWVFRVDGGPGNSILNNNVVGLRVRLSSFLDLTQISTEIVLQQVKQELVKYGLPNNIELKLRKLQKIKP